MHEILLELADQIKHLRQNKADDREALAILEKAKGLPDVLTITVAQILLTVTGSHPRVLQAVARLALPPFDIGSVASNLATFFESTPSEEAFQFLGQALLTLGWSAGSSPASVPTLAWFLARAETETSVARQLTRQLFRRNQPIREVQSLLAQYPWLKPLLAPYWPTTKPGISLHRVGAVLALTMLCFAGAAVCWWLLPERKAKLQSTQPTQPDLDKGKVEIDRMLAEARKTIQERDKQISGLQNVLDASRAEARDQRANFGKFQEHLEKLEEGLKRLEKANSAGWGEFLVLLKSLVPSGEAPVQRPVVPPYSYYGLKDAQEIDNKIFGRLEKYFRKPKGQPPPWTDPVRDPDDYLVIDPTESMKRIAENIPSRKR